MHMNNPPQGHVYPEASTSRLPDLQMPSPDSGPAPPPMTQFVNPARNAHLPFPNLTSSNTYPHPSHFQTGNPDSDQDSQDAAYSSSEDDASSSPSELPSPPRMKSTVPLFGSGSTRTVLDMPLRGTKDAPKLFRGHHAEVEYFIAHYDRLLVKFHVTDPNDQCKLILDYCSTDVQGFIRASKYYQQRKWLKLRREILQSYDADRATSRYKPSDIATYTLKTQAKPFQNLSQWKKYFIKYKTMAGILLQQGHITQVNYDVYFWLGIQLDLRRTLEQRINQLNPTRSFNRQYSVREINVAAEWYFRRNRAEAMVVNAADYGVDLDSDTTDVESEEESEDSDDSDYETYRRKHRAKARAKKVKAKKKAKKASSNLNGTSKGKTLQTTGTAEEVTSLIRQLNKMSINDPEYPPVYYKVLSLDTTGIAAKCVQPPRIAPAWLDSGPRGPPKNKDLKSPAPENTGAGTASTYPNNIPLGASSAARNDNFGCYGCGQDGHRIGDCPEIKELVAKDIVFYDPENRRVRMKNGSFIRRGQGETLAQAAARLAAPRVMFTTANRGYESQYETRHTGYQSAYIEVLPSESESEYDSAQDQREIDAHWYAQPSDPDDVSGSDREVYVTVPRGLCEPDQKNNVHAAERSVPSTRTARREVFDGVQMPKRDRSGPNHVTGPHNSPAKAVDQKGKVKDSPEIKSSVKKVRDLLPELTPADVRVPRTDIDVEMEPPTRVEENLPKEKRSSIAPAKKHQEGSNRQEENPPKPAARHSDIQGTVHVPSIIERILDLTIPMTVREAFVSSKEIRTGILETIRLKNVKAVLLGKSHNNPLVANWNWPRTEGILIRVDVETNGKIVTAIIDTGSQLDVVRADVAALKIRHPVDMCKVMSMNDANGGRGELRGYISDVEFNCGGVMTRTDLWVSHQAPFELLLGRPWQRGNLVTIDERDEGTYLVFKDPETRQPRYELLAIPYEVAREPHTGGANNAVTQSLLFTAESPLLHADKNNFSPAAPELRYNGEQCKNSNNSTHQLRGTLVPKILRVALELLFLWTVWTAFGAKRIPTMIARSFWKGSLVSEFGELKGQVFSSGIPPPFPLSSEESHLPIRPGMPPLNPNAPPFHPSSYPLTPQLPPPHFTTPRPNRTYPNNSRRHEPGARISPLAPITCDVLDRTRTHHFGHETRLPRGGNVLTRVRAASNHQWRRQRQGQPPEVRPGSVVAPQTLFTGHETRPNGQELFHAVFLNARMLINNPLTGHPGMVNGHVLATLVAAPTDERPWPYEVAFPSSPHTRNSLGNYGRAVHTEVGRQRRPGGPYRLHIDRQIEHVQRSTAHAMDVADGIPSAPIWTTVPLPQMHAPAPQRLLEAPPALISTPAHPTTSPFTTTPLDVVMRSRNVNPTRPSTSPYTTTPLDVVMRSRNSKGDRDNWRAPYFLTHPPNEPPKCDTRAMVRFGTEARTGHHVLRPIRTRRGRGRRPDTPVPPFRLLTERPELLEDGDRAGEDASMPSASPRSASLPPASPHSPDLADNSPLARIEENERSTAFCSPLPQGWAASNARLEKLQGSLQRGVLSTSAAPDQPGIQGLVFGVYKTLADVANVPKTAETAAAGTSTPEIDAGSNEDDRMDTDESFAVVNNDEGGETPNDFSHDVTGGSEREAVRSRSSSLSSLSSSFDFVRHEDTSLVPTGETDPASPLVESSVNSGSHDTSFPYPLDCRSTLPSPQLQPLFLDESDHDSLPSLQTISSDNESLPEQQAAASPRSEDDTTNVDRAELDTQILRIARPPSTPINRNWPITIGWTHHHASFVSNVHSAEHADALAFIRHATALIERSPDVLDYAGMQLNIFVELDLPRDPEDDNLTSEACTQFTERVQNIRDTLAAYSLELDNGGRTAQNVTSVPVSLDGQRERLFSHRALSQPFAYRYIIDILARHHPDWIELYTLLRNKILGFNRYLEDLFKRRGWFIDEILLHQPAPPLPPYLKPSEYSRLRLFKYTLELQGYLDVARVIDDFLRYRFREPEVVAHFLHSGMFDPHDIYLSGAGGAKFITRRTAPKSHRASCARMRSFRKANLSFQKRQRVDMRSRA
ncbi:hypothetical protein DFH06DRAFT_1315490 [Mycena polygramma]|nr:hypothetical protein DFH06DRAFT_1315490 [Mycena polygramma]